MAPLYDVRSVVVCDEVRVETSGKFILLGTYPSIAMQVFPILVPRLAVYVELKPSKKKFDLVSIILRDPSEKEIGRAEGPFQFPFISLDTGIFGLLQNITLTEPGQYGVFLQMDGPPEMIRTYFINSHETLQTLSQQENSQKRID
jgi:hypothetical protein